MKKIGLISILILSVLFLNGCNNSNKSSVDANLIESKNEIDDKIQYYTGTYDYFVTLSGEEIKFEEVNKDSLYSENLIFFKESLFTDYGDKQKEIDFERYKQMIEYDNENDITYLTVAQINQLLKKVGCKKEIKAYSDLTFYGTSYDDYSTTVVFEDGDTLYKLNLAYFEGNGAYKAIVKCKKVDDNFKAKFTDRKLEYAKKPLSLEDIEGNWEISETIIATEEDKKSAEHIYIDNKGNLFLLTSYEQVYRIPLDALYDINVEKMLTNSKFRDIFEIDLNIFAVLLNRNSIVGYNQYSQYTISFFEENKFALSSLSEGLEFTKIDSEESSSEEIRKAIKVFDYVDKNYSGYASIISFRNAYNDADYQIAMYKDERYSIFNDTKDNEMYADTIYLNKSGTSYTEYVEDY